MNHIHYRIIDTNIGPIGLAATDKGLLHIELRCPPEDDFAALLEKKFGPEIEPDPQGRRSQFLRDAAKEIREYLESKRERFEVALDMRGPEFMVKVMRAMLKIPYGGTKSYGQIARLVGNPKAARAVGRAVGANPLPLIVPCHRVVGSDGGLVGFGSGIDLKAHLLDLENRAASR